MARRPPALLEPPSLERRVWLAWTVVASLTLLIGPPVIMSIRHGDESASCAARPRAEVEEVTILDVGPSDFGGLVEVDVAMTGKITNVGSSAVDVTDVKVGIQGGTEPRWAELTEPPPGRVEPGQQVSFAVRGTVRQAHDAHSEPWAELPSLDLTAADPDRRLC